MADGAQVEITPVAAGDAADWRRLFTAYLGFYRTTVEDEVLTTSFRRLLGNDQQDFRGLIARVDGRAAGIAHFLFHRHMWRVRNVCYLQDLWAEPEFRGRGIGRSLIETVYDAADAAGAPDVYWLTAEDNATARRLYDRVGRLTPFIRYNRA